MPDLNINEDLINNYQKLTNDIEIFHEISYIEFYNKMNNGKNSLIYLGKPTCPICVKFVPMLHDILAAKNMHIDYFNVDTFFENNSSDKINYINFFQTLNISQLPSLIFTHGDMNYQRLPIYTIKTPINAWITAINDK
ncbi:thioredoxin family protein [Leuconostoc mesenteroides]|uniref:thioredoxin family protein n=1 Tax=Leuconostoc mesenteroides TaxID=1245 RepID=UPI001CBC10E5|nr:thioredoxin family protein [Leuconostoc mesenteroides]MBZ1510636.1 thioredoxin family protein [Leuconostoc mesenteroides]